MTGISGFTYTERNRPWIHKCAVVSEDEQVTKSKVKLQGEEKDKQDRRNSSKGRKGLGIVKRY